MSIRENFNLKAYFVVGPENTGDREVADVVRDAVSAGFTFVQLRSKVASAKEMLFLCGEIADVLKELKCEECVPLVVDDRMDIVLAARYHGIKVDGIHVGQSDIRPDICRHYLGEDAIIGLSAPTKDLIAYVQHTKISGMVDYYGAGPVHETETKKDCGLDEHGNIITRTMEELTELARNSPVPVVVGGGVKARDLASIKKTGVDGFFVVSAVAGAENPHRAAKELVDTWEGA